MVLLWLAPAWNKLLLVLAGIHTTDILEFVFPPEKSLISHRKQRNVQAGLQTRGLQIAYNSHITACHRNSLARQDQSHCHPFRFNFNLHEIMPFLLRSAQLHSSPPPFHLSVASKMLLSVMSPSVVTLVTFACLRNALSSSQVFGVTLLRGRIKVKNCTV